jgi:transcriptional regulator with XRE-family HTH domain
MDSRPSGLPVEPVTIDQVVALNVRHWRIAAGLTQAELGERLGWSAAVVSAAERSAVESRDRRRFDAQTLTELSLALGVPLAALFLPPPDDGERASYRFTAGGRTRAMEELMDLVVMPDTLGDSPLLGAYRRRAEAAARRVGAGPARERLLERWTAGNPGVREAAVADLRAAADRVAALADAIEKDSGR